LEIRNARSNASLLADFNLECLGLACRPAELQALLMPFTLKSTRKIVHVRQTGQHHTPGKDYKSRALLSANKLVNQGIEVEKVTTTKGKVTVPYSDLQNVLDPTFKKFLKLAFGPKGISSLQVVVFGDFSHYRYGLFTHNLFICRSNKEEGAGGETFQVFDARDREHAERWEEYLDPQEDFFIACPTGPYVPIEGQVY
ncbi:uncharacterized protein C8A04DRAFT_16008, partial [Dichotomopilus funicola]